MGFLLLLDAGSDESARKGKNLPGKEAVIFDGHQIVIHALLT